MIIGKGMIAQAFASYKNNKKVCIFASGVSNSREIRSAAFKREAMLLSKISAQNQKSIVVYFSCYFLHHKKFLNIPYYAHKKNMESIVRQHPRYLIVRLPQIVGKTKNKNTLVNFFADAIAHNKRITIERESTRNLIDIDDVVMYVDTCLKRTISQGVVDFIYPRNITPGKIVTILEKILKKKGKIVHKAGGSRFRITPSAKKSSEFFWKENDKLLQKKYYELLLKKYYSS